MEICTVETCLYIGEQQHMAMGYILTLRVSVGYREGIVRGYR